ncbi:DUF5677 domain-containing protein [Acidovorax sp.]|uniref:DUF5677 domain-containing protein n=1 Tax=Acidovorax sp. TaxID=1872122 RepID=UPI002ACDDC42|nr:DUF5677 domain-containing protein [Acidovorax sp.]MDZ7862667.1 DUF5677 domain-containing protein [Acidovorax sp.]
MTTQPQLTVPGKTLDELYEIADAALENALEAFPLGAPEGMAENKGWIGGLAMWLRAIECAEATLLLVRQGMGGAAWSTLRTGYECLFFAGALWNKPENHTRLESNHHFERLKQVGELLKPGQIELLDEKTKQMLQELAAADAGPHKGWSAQEAAKDAKLLTAYQWIYRGSSLAGAHGSQRSLDGHFKKLEDGTHEFSYEKNFMAAPIQVSWIAHLLVLGTNALKGHHQPSPPPNPE